MVDEIRLLGNHPVLDFVNTVDDRVHHEGDVLADYAGVLGWALRRGVVESGDAAALARLSRRHPRDAARAFTRATALREHLYLVFAALAAGDAPPEADLVALQRVFVSATRSAHLEGDASAGFSWSWSGADSLDAIAWAIASRAVELLFSDDMGRLKMCPGHDCGWVFLDQSRNRSRRWCSMEGCGSRAKMRTLYRRQRSSAGAPPR